MPYQDWGGWDRQKPPRGTSINRGHPLTYGLVACYMIDDKILGTLNSLVYSGTPGDGMAIVSGTTFTNSWYGRALASDTNGHGARSTVLGRNLKSQNISMVWGGHFTGFNGVTADVFASIYDSTSANSPFVCYGLSWSSSNAIMRWFWNNSSGFQSVNSATTFTARIPYILVGTLNTTSPLSALYVNGILDASTTSNIGTIAYHANSQLNLGIGPTWSLGDPDCRSAFGYVYNRELKASEVRQISADPFCIFEPPSTRRYFFGVNQPVGATDTDSFVSVS